MDGRFIKQIQKEPHYIENWLPPYLGVLPVVRLKARHNVFMSRDWANGISLFLVRLFLTLLCHLLLLLFIFKNISRNLFDVLVVCILDSVTGLVLDSETANRLEVVSSLNPTGGPSLLSALNSCQTAAGKRLLRSNLLEPMTDREAIRQRLDAVEELASRPTDLHQPIKVHTHTHAILYA